MENCPAIIEHYKYTVQTQETLPLSSYSLVITYCDMTEACEQLTNYRKSLKHVEYPLELVCQISELQHFRMNVSQAYA